MALLGNIFTFFSYLSYWISRFGKTKEKMLIWDIISKILTVISFIFLGVLTAIGTNIIGTIRPFVAIKLDRLGKLKYKILASIGFGIISITLLFFTYTGLSSVLITVITLISTTVLFTGNAQAQRIFGIPISITYVFFQLSCVNYVGVVCEIIVLGCNIISFLKYRKE